MKLRLDETRGIAINGFWCGSQWKQCAWGCPWGLWWDQNKAPLWSLWASPWWAYELRYWHFWQLKLTVQRRLFAKNICMVVYRTEVMKACEIAIYSDVMIEADATYYLIMHSCNEWNADHKMKLYTQEKKTNLMLNDVITCICFFYPWSLPFSPHY